MTDGNERKKGGFRDTKPYIELELYLQSKMYVYGNRFPHILIHSFDEIYEAQKQRSEKNDK